MMAIYIPLVSLVVWLFGSMRCNPVSSVQCLVRVRMTHNEFPLYPSEEVRQPSADCPPLYCNEC